MAVFRAAAGPLVAACLAVCGVAVAEGGLLELFVGPRMGRSAGEWGADGDDGGGGNVSAAQNLIESFGYPFEEHRVVTQDGYKLVMHRIPHGRNITKETKPNDLRPVVFLQHGYLGSSDMFLFRGPNKDLPYILADSGCDVWMSNMRGNVYSKGHISLNPDHDWEFWRFSLHEVAYYDLPSQIDYVLKMTKAKALYFFGYSLGSTIAIMLSTLRPEYNSKIKLHISLAPFMFFAHEATMEQKLLLSTVPVLFQWALSEKILCMLPRRQSVSRIFEFTCRDGIPTQRLCFNSVFSFVGRNLDQIDHKYIPQMAKYFPAGTGIYLGMHGFQFLEKGNLQPFDYGDEVVNVKMYNSTLLPIYNFTLVTHPVLLVYGNLDIIVTAKDIGLVKKTLPNVVETHQVPFNHMDFIWGKDTKVLLYDRLVSLIKKYS